MNEKYCWSFLTHSVYMENTNCITKRFDKFFGLNLTVKNYKEQTEENTNFEMRQIKLDFSRV